jgi:hypothetical protein
MCYRFRMIAAGKTLRIILWTAVVVVVLPLALYLFALVVNLNDEPPSPAAVELTAVGERPPIADADNAYVFLLGLGAPRDADPAALGAERAARIRDAAAEPERGFAPNLFAGDAPVFGSAPGLVRTALDACDIRNAVCVAALDAAGDADLGLADYRWQIDRYRTWLGYRAWREITTGDTRGPLAPYALPRYPRRLFLLETWQLAAAGNAEQVRDRLTADLVLWRLALAETDSLIGKAIAASFIAEHFEWGNLILRRLPPQQRAAGVPPAWRIPLTGAERSMRRVLANEWRSTARSLRSLKTHGLVAPLPPGAEDPRSMFDRLTNRLALPLLQPQASANRDAAVLLELTQLLDAPYAELPAALARAAEVDERPTGVLSFTYNLLGRALMISGRAFLADYGARVADLEGVRRAALLAADLRGVGAVPLLAGTMIPLAAARNPYTGGPFEWTAEPPAVEFTGLERGARAHHSFLY